MSGQNNAKYPRTVTLDVEFHTHRYHATPWGRHPREGVHEWPPSPYRLIRALTSSWRTYGSNIEEEVFIGILHKIASTNPCMVLPRAATAHTRHWVPPAGKGKRIKILDTFVILDKDPFRFVWNDIRLTYHEIKILDQVALHVRYFGRSESWCTMSVWAGDDVPETACMPLALNMLNNNYEIVLVLAPKPNITLSDIEMSTGEMRRKRMLMPPHTEYVQYARPADCFIPQNNKQGDQKLCFPISINASELPQRTRFSCDLTPFTNQINRKSVKCLDWETKLDQMNKTVLQFGIVNRVKPPITKTLRIAELFRRSIMSTYDKADKTTNPLRTERGGEALTKPLGNESTSVWGLLSGHNEKGLLTGHRHAHYLPADYDGDGRIDRIVLWAPAGFTDTEASAMAGVRKLWPWLKDGLGVAYEGSGQTEDFGGLFGTSRMWQSVTPYVRTKHTKRRGGKIKDSAEDQIRHELDHRYNLAPIRIRCMHDGLLGKWKLHEFEYRRDSSNPVPGLFKVEIMFAEPVRGPLALGYGSHFGVGLFMPSD